MTVSPNVFTFENKGKNLDFGRTGDTFYPATLSNSSLKKLIDFASRYFEFRDNYLDNESIDPESTVETD